MIKAVIFDIDGVLIDSLDANTQFYQKVLVKFGYKKPLKRDIQKIFHMTFMDGIRHLTKEKSEERILEMFNYGMKIPYPINKLRVPAYANRTLLDLSKKYTLAIVTNRTPRGIKNYFRSAKTMKFFSVVIGRDDFKNPKPHPEPLLVALKHLSLKPGEAVYVGDTRTDMEAAMAADMKFILYSKKPIKDAHIRVKNFKELYTALKRFD
jgi:phosphoglycolate phosphatase